MRPSTTWSARFSHGAALAAVLFGLAVALSAKANYQAVRESLSSRFRLIVVLQPGLPDALIEETRGAIEALPGVAMARARDPQADAAALLSSEPWAADYQEFLQSGFLPQIFDTTLVNPYGSPRALEDAIARIRSMDAVSQTAYYQAAYERTRAALGAAERILRATLAALIILTVLAAAPLELLCGRAEQRRPAAATKNRDPWLAPRMIGGASAAIAAILVLFVCMAFINRSSGFRLTYPAAPDIGLLLAVGIIAPVAAGSAVRLFMDLAGAPRNPAPGDETPRKRPSLKEPGRANPREDPDSP